MVNGSISNKQSENPLIKSIGSLSQGRIIDELKVCLLIQIAKSQAVTAIIPLFYIIIFYNNILQ